MGQVDKIEEVRIMRSFISGNSFGRIIEEKYDLGDVESCKLFSKLLRTQDNDHYLVKTATGEEYVARIYQSGDSLNRQESDYLFELDWLNYLKENELPVSHPIANKNGAYLGAIDAPEGLRYYALFSVAEGEKMERHNKDHLYLLGMYMARIHVVSNDFHSGHVRYKSDLGFLLDEPLRRIRKFWGNRNADQLEILTTSASEHKSNIRRLLGSPSKAGDAWGIIGGDFHNANARVDRHNNPTFFNFDLCGPGWRAYDIAVMLSNTDIHRTVEMSEAFFAGYYSVRRLAQEEHEAIDSFMSIRRIWLMGSFAIDEGVAGHTFVAPA